jgi:hypothetical protein
MLVGASHNEVIVQKQIIDNPKNVETLSKLFNKCVYYSLDVDASVDVMLAAQMCMSLHGVTSDFEMSGTLIDFHSM